jgi:uncharacterized surface protein with fasciclin (FAS1) repeats
MDSRKKDIVENAASSGHFKWLSDALKTAGLVNTYKGAGPFTFFAPTDEAFEKIPPGALRRLLEDKARLAAILNFHVIRGATPIHDLAASDSRSFQGGTLNIAATDTGFTVNGANLGRNPIEASNGVIHAIDQVMMPETTP